MESTGQPKLQRLLNFRDIAHSISTSTNSEILRRGLLYRSGRPDDATPVDRMYLADHYKLKTIIDLRSDAEHAEQAKNNSLKAAGADDSLRVPNAKYEHINFNGRAYTIALVRQLSYWDFGRFFYLYTLGYRKEAISVIGQNVMAERGVVGLAEDSLKHCTAEVKAVFDVLSNADNYPLLVHCTQGKDRTGLVTLLVLLLLHVPERAINEDYLLSEQELQLGKALRLEEIRSIGLPEEFAGCPKDWVERVCKGLNEAYGGVEAYLQDGCGVSREQLKSIRSILLCN